MKADILVLRITRELNSLYQWRLSEQELEGFVEEISPYVLCCEDDETIQRVITNYYISGPTVRLFVDSRTEAWKRDAIAMSWNEYLRKVVGQIWLRRGPITGCEIEDVVQVAWKDILKGLKGFKFQSKLETWLFTLVANADRGLRRKAIGRREEPRENIWEYQIDNNLQTSGDTLTEVVRKEREDDIKEAMIESLLEVAQTRKRLNEWIKCSPNKLDDLAKMVIQVLVGDIRQHELATNYLSLSEPTISRVIKDLKIILPHRLRERNYCSSTSNVIGTEVKS